MLDDLGPGLKLEDRLGATVQSWYFESAAVSSEIGEPRLVVEICDASRRIGGSSSSRKESV